jgi:hypothetical protein
VVCHGIEFDEGEVGIGDKLVPDPRVNDNGAGSFDGKLLKGGVGGVGLDIGDTPAASALKEDKDFGGFRGRDAFVVMAAAGGSCGTEPRDPKKGGGAGFMWNTNFGGGA